MTAVAAFRGDRAAEAPLTWGQQGIWKIIEMMAPNDAFLNLRRVVPVPEQVAGTVDSVATAVGALISRHESLRTRIMVIDGEPRQVVADAGECPLALIEATAETAADVAAQAMERLRHQPFDYAGELPIRVTLVVAEGQVRFVVLILTHVAVDWAALALLDRELRVLLLHGAVTAPVGIQPVDLAGLEHSKAGQQRSARARTHWQAQYSRFPPSIFAAAGPPAEPRYRRAELTSPALLTACRIIAARHSASSSTVLLAAAGALIGARTGHEICGMLTIVNNRFQHGHRDIMAPTNQLGVITLDRRGATTFGDLVIAVWREALQCFWHAYYDQHVLDRFLADGGHLHGEKIEPFCCFNDMRTGGNDLRDVEATADQLRASLKESELTWPETFDEFNWHFMLSVSDSTGALSISLSTDSCYLPPDEQRRFLLDLEELVVRAATGEVRLDELGGQKS